jgi:selenocysteine-specific elongation factor
VQSSYVMIGTAGHIDHGKTTLIKALTGIDTDRLKEEKERGITIDLGFAALTLKNGQKLGIIDVPGHERFIRNMLAGVAGIDLIMMVIDVNEGVMPQTREHLAILELLGISCGVIVLTKVDMAEPEWIELVQHEVRQEFKGTFLEDAPIIPVSAVTGAGISQLLQELERLVGQVQHKPTVGPAKMPIDRVFTVPGFGTVVTGTLWRGTIRLGDPLQVYPQEVNTRVRSIEVHGERVGEAYAGQRVALNVTGLEREAVERGSVIAAPASLQTTDLVVARFWLLPDGLRPLRSGSRIRFHIGTSEVMGRILLLDRDELKTGDNALVQIRLETPVACEARDRFVVRRYSPVTTIGGGIILDQQPQRLYRRKRAHILRQLEQLENMDENRLIVRWLTDHPLSTQQEILQEGLHSMGISSPDLALQILQSGVTSGEIVRIEVPSQHPDDQADSSVYAARSWLSDRIQEVEQGSRQYYKQRRLDVWIPSSYLVGKWSELHPKQAERLLQYAEQNRILERKGNVYRLPGYSPQLTKLEEQVKQGILQALSENPFQPPGQADLERLIPGKERTVREILAHLKHIGSVVEIAAGIWMTQQAVEQAVAIVKQLLQRQDAFTVAEFRDAAGTSRKYAVALLEYLDRQKITRREGDARTRGSACSHSI